MERLELAATFIVAASGTYLEKLEEQSSNLEQVIKEAERQLKVATRKLEALKYDLSRRPTSKLLVSELEAQQAEVDIITGHLGEFAKRRKYYVTFASIANEDEDAIANRIQNLYRVWQGEVAKRESMGNEHGVIAREEVKMAMEKRRQAKLQKAKEQQQQVKLALEQRAQEQAEEKKKKEDSIPRILGIRAW